MKETAVLVDLNGLTPEELRHLAAAKEARSPETRARKGLAPEAIDELATMLLSGRRPSLGWWRRAPRIQAKGAGRR